MGLSVKEFMAQDFWKVDVTALCTLGES